VRELALHLLDMIENSFRAGASRVTVSISEDTRRDLLELRVDDDGPGLSVPKRVAVDPFYTTKEGKRTGLGLSLLNAGAERAAGRLSLRRSGMGGLSVRACMRLSHVDRAPLGDLARTLGAASCTHPEVDFRVRISMNGAECGVSTRELRMADPVAARRRAAAAAGGRDERANRMSPIELSQQFAGKVREAMAALGVVE